MQHVHKQTKRWNRLQPAIGIKLCKRIWDSTQYFDRRTLALIRFNDMLLIRRNSLANVFSSLFRKIVDLWRKSNKNFNLSSEMLTEHTHINRIECNESCERKIDYVFEIWFSVFGIFKGWKCLLKTKSLMIDEQVTPTTSRKHNNLKYKSCVCLRESDWLVELTLM